MITQLKKSLMMDIFLNNVYKKPEMKTNIHQILVNNGEIFQKPS